jgi:hypothetical protein
MRVSAAAIAIVAVPVTTGTAAGAMPPLYRNCSHLDARNPHGVGKVGAHDRNRGLDRDHDGVACEQP